MTKNLALYFQGKWQFEREIIFSETKEHYAEAAGEAIFELSLTADDELYYKEKGKVVLADTKQNTTFFRCYRYVFHGAELDIFFQDELTQNFNVYQSYTYESESHSLIAKEKHLCNKDIYEGRFLLNDAAHFVHITLIKGPHKDYFITTHFSKVV